jgi:uncharacterized membrane protein YeaQ/YmgE (transglycosylase-associated protein family)
MFLLASILIGAVVGWRTGRILEGKGYGPFMDVAMGIGGAVGSGFLMRSTGLDSFGGTMVVTLVALSGAVLLTLLAGYMNGRRIYAGQF